MPTTAPYTTTVGAHGRFSKARINLGTPDLGLAASVVAAGGGTTSGGAAAFDAQKFITDVAGQGAPSELAALTKRFGAADIALFDKTFDYFITDALAQSNAIGIALPATPQPAPVDGRSLAAALYAAGFAPRGSFDTEYMLDGLFSHVVHVAVMNDIEANPDLGPPADANFHTVLGRLMLDLKAQYALAAPASPAPTATGGR